MFGIAAPAVSDACLVWPDYWEACEVFVMSSTQWRLSATGTLLGLDYTAVHAVMIMLGVSDHRECLSLISEIEREVLKLTHARSKI